MRNRPMINMRFAGWGAGMVLGLAMGAMAQEWGPGYVPDIPKCMGSAVQDICPMIRQVSWLPSQPKVGQDIRVSVTLFMDEELTDGRVMSGQVVATYPDGTRLDVPLENQNENDLWTCQLPASSSSGPLTLRVEATDSFGNRAVEVPEAALSWPPSQDQLLPVIGDREGEEVVSKDVDLTKVWMGLDEKNLAVILRTDGRIKVAQEMWYLYAVGAARRDYKKEDQGEEIGSADFLIYFPFLFKGAIVNPLALGDLSLTGMLGQEGDAKTLLLKDGSLAMTIPREKFQSNGGDPFKLFAISLALDPSKGLDLTLMKGGDATPYALITPGQHEINVAP